MNTSPFVIKSPAHQRAARRQRGVSLLEALIAFLVLSLGMLAVIKVQPNLRLQTETARQRAEAVRLAQQEIETLRGFAVLAPRPGLAAYDTLSDATRTVDATTGYASTTRYQLIRTVAAEGAAAKSITVTAQWTDRQRQPQQLALHTLIAASDPALAGSAGLARGGVSSLGALGRSATIPLAAKSLGDGRSAFKPQADGSVALVFDDISGAVVARCAGIDVMRTNAALTTADLRDCDAARGLLLSGVVRFSSTLPPDASHANDAPLPLTIDLAPSTPMAQPTWCASEAQTTDAGERALAYRCVVYPAAGGAWSGKVLLRPSGWRVGTGAGEHRVCRFARDLDGSGAIDANIEHPASYTAVATALVQQNFLVVDGRATCPGDALTALATVQQQP